MGPDPFEDSHSWAAQPQGAGSAHACPLGTAVAPLCGCFPRAPLPPPPQHVEHYTLTLPWDSAWQEQGLLHVPHLSYPPCLSGDTARTKDCTHWELGTCCSAGQGDRG